MVNNSNPNWCLVVSGAPLKYLYKLLKQRSEGTISKFVCSNKQEEEGKGRTVLHRTIINTNIDRFESWANENYTRLTKPNYKVLHLRGNPKLRHNLEQSVWGASSARKVLRILVGAR